MKKSELIRLYSRNKLSMQEIAIVLGCSLNKIAYWKKKYDIKSRSRSEATYVKRNKTGDPYKIKNKLTMSDLILYGIGMGLYWGEGTKADKGSVRLGNSDPYLIKKFIYYLKRICGVNEKKLKFWLQLFSDIDRERAIGYWKKELGLVDFKPSITISLSQNKGSYKNKGKFGVLTLYVGNIKLRNWLGEQLIICRDSSAGRARHW